VIKKKKKEEEGWNKEKEDVQRSYLKKQKRQRTL
jgi:hypothetical protein